MNLNIFKYLIFFWHLFFKTIFYENDKAAGEKFAVIACYDACFARLAEQAGIEVVLVGDSLGMVMLGYDTTVRVSIDEMLHHPRAVARGAKRSMVVGDMPFLSYGVSTEESVRRAMAIQR